MRRKLEFLSPEWLETLHKTLIKYTSKLDPGLSFGFCESYFNVPKHLATEGKDGFSFHMQFANGKLHFSTGKNENLSIFFRGDYQFILPFARTAIDASNAKDYEMKMEEGVKLGKVFRKGDFGAVPPQLAGLHNEMAELTK